MAMHDRLSESRKIVVKVDAELSGLIPAFLKNRDADIVSMLEALEKRDYKIIERTGHGMKGAGSGFGFDAVSEIGGRIEKAAQNKNSEEIQKGIGDLSEFLQHLEVFYE